MSPLTPPSLAVIAAVARNGIIGRDNAMPWHLSEDLKRFRAITTGHVIIMGRRTYESLGKPLPQRRNLVVTGRRDFAAPGCEIVHSLDEALARCAGQDEVFVIGGGELYRQALPRARRLYLTEIDADFDGDTRFPDYDRDNWREVSRESHVSATGLAFAFVVYERVV